MSIINDALKKTQQNLAGGGETGKTGTPPEMTPQETSATRSNTPLILLMLAMMLGAVFLITLELKPHITALAGQYRSLLDAAAKPAPPQAPAPAPSPQPAPAQEKPADPLPPETPDGPFINRFKLNGVLNSKDGNAALINNNVYQEGDNIEGYTIREILPKKVILEKDGGIINLEARN